MYFKRGMRWKEGKSTSASALDKAKVYGARPENETSRFFLFFLGPLAFCSGPIM